MPGIGKRTVRLHKEGVPGMRAHGPCLAHALIEIMLSTDVGEVSETVGETRLHIGERDVRGAFGEMHGQPPAGLQ